MPMPQMSPGIPPAPAPSPQNAGAGSPPPQTPPMGSTPAVTPGQNQGMMMAGVQKVGTALKMLTEALNSFGPTSDEGAQLVNAIRTLQ